jgi:hypothetical protein
MSLTLASANHIDDSMPNWRSTADQVGPIGSCHDIPVVNLFEYGRFLHPSFGTDLAVMSVRCEAEFDQTLSFGFRVVDAGCDMAVPAALVPRQFDLRIGLAIAQINQCEFGEVEPMRDAEMESLLVELQRALQVLHADHHVDQLGHVAPPCC